MAYKMCSHLYAENRCPTPGCKHNDTRELAIQIFGPNPNSALASKIHHEDKAKYAQLQERGRELQLLPPAPKTPSWLQP